MAFSAGITKIRHAEAGDVRKIAEIEGKCFPVEEAASLESIEKRVKVFPNHFWLLFDCDETGGERESSLHAKKNSAHFTKNSDL